MFLLICLSFFKVHQFEKDLEKLRTRQKTEMEQKLKQMSADERRLLKHIKDKHDNDMKMFLSDQKAAYKAAKNQFKKVCFPALTFSYADVLLSDWAVDPFRTRDLSLLLPIIGHIIIVAVLLTNQSARFIFHCRTRATVHPTKEGRTRYTPPRKMLCVKRRMSMKLCEMLN